jgi:ABC-2 type transport system permease protein
VSTVDAAAVTTATPPRAAGELRTTGNPTAAIGRHAFRLIWKGSVVVALVFGATAASSAASYVSTFPTEASRQALATSFTGDSGFTVLFGSIAHIDTVGGYTVYKTYVFLTTIGAIWAALAATRLLRGEEDAGRWQLMLAGRTNAARATTATLLALVAAMGVVFAGTTILVLAVGAKPDVGFSAADSLIYGLTTAAAPLVFAAVAATCSQLAQTRRLATGLSMAVFGVCFVIRMIGDSNPSAHWLLWLTPLGWVELVEPFTTNDLRPFVPIVLLTAVAGGVAVMLASRRDAGAGAIATNEVRPPRAAGLRSPLGLATRLNFPVLLAWLVGVTATSFVFGIVTKAVADAIDSSGSVTSVLSELGAQGSSALQYLGAVFLITGAVLALVPASQIGPARDEEASGRLSQLLAAPVTRVAWLAGRVALAAVALIVFGVLAGVAGWLGVASQGLSVDFGKLVVAGINIVPAALLALGVGVFMLGVLPRYATIAVYAIVGWSLIIDLLGSLITGLDFLTHLSLFHYVALAPSEDPNWASLGIMTLIAVLLTIAGIALFTRRDLALD